MLIKDDEVQDCYIPGPPAENIEDKQVVKKKRGRPKKNKDCVENIKKKKSFWDFLER